MRSVVRTTRAPRWWVVYKTRVWWPAWVGRAAYAWQGGVVAVLWPLALWAGGAASFAAAGHTLRLLILATGFGWFGTACCAAAAVLPFVGGALMVAAAFRPAPTSADRARALALTPTGVSEG
jgi:hypothetical protein